MTTFNKKTVYLIIIAVFLTLGTGCAPMYRAGIKVAHPVLENMEVALFQQKNLDLVQQGIPGTLMMLEGLLETSPNDMLLLTMAAKAYTGLGMMIEIEDPAQASALYVRGSECGLQALKQHRGFRRALENGKNMSEAARQITSQKYVPALMWTAASMGANVLINADDPMVAIDLAPVNTMVNQVVELDSHYFHGIAHMFVGTINSMMPETFGGDKEKARQAFELVSELTDGHFLLPKVFYATYYLTDDERIEKTLQAVADAPDGLMPEIELMNQIAKARAGDLLN